MIIKALVENTTQDECLQTEHGLSLYVQTAKHNLLFDVGQGELFAKNADYLEVPIAQVDSLIISHGHYDHGGGLNTFCKLNQQAPVYIQKRAFENHLVKTANSNHFIGLKQEPGWLARLVFVEDYLRLDDELEIFAQVTGRKFCSPANDILLMEENGQLKPDDFGHEQNLLITTGNKLVLVAGCAHNGIVNIMEKCMALKGRAPDVVIGGFHLMMAGASSNVPDGLVDDIAGWLKQHPTRYFTGHCTGQPAYERLRAILGEQINYLATGVALHID